MKETLKSAALALLIAASLVQSYFLIYRLPGTNPVVKTENDYVATENMGDELDVSRVIFPKQLVVHLGGNKHTVFYPDSTFYNLIFSRLQARQFDGFQRDVAQSRDWSKIRSEDEGIELEFGTGVPVSLLQKIMQIAPDPLFESESIDRIFLYSAAGEDKVHVFFFSVQGDVVYEAAKADLTVQDLKQHVDFGRTWMPYTLVDNTYYVPEEPLEMVEGTLGTGQYTVEQMQRSLFFDPSITRNIREKDGSEIYTDSKRSLQVRQNQNWINYTDPAVPAAGEDNLGKNGLSAVDFVNQHGGFSGTYRMELGEETDGKQTVQFQQYYSSFPIIDVPEFHYGVMKLEMQQGTTTVYERSLIYLKTDNQSKKMVQLPYGQALKDKIAAAAGGGTIKELYPGYRPSLGESGMTLTPVWVLEMEDGTVQVLK
ncbi:YycH family regulatory protein [Paenibacillus pinistramenti]|uniref:YycH family regulatory protein n=1 Tax=Paenibacillus pinistramenti TaxID=1768003 RepID=UPI00110906AE|nr:two-component system activity regulator YycH [Paenibacillus pinistramenti]